MAAQVGELLDARIPSPDALQAMGNFHVNCAVIDGLAWLANVSTDDSERKRLLALCTRILESWSIKGNGDWLRNSQAGREFYEAVGGAGAGDQGGASRWEVSHATKPACRRAHCAGRPQFTLRFHSYRPPHAV